MRTLHPHMHRLHPGGGSSSSSRSGGDGGIGGWHRLLLTGGGGFWGRQAPDSNAISIVNING